MSKSVHQGGRKRRDGRKRRLASQQRREQSQQHENPIGQPAPPQLEYDPLGESAEDAERARRSRRDRHHRHLKHLHRTRKKEPGGYYYYSEDDDDAEEDYNDEPGSNPYEEVQITEDNSMAVLANLQSQATNPSTMPSNTTGFTGTTAGSEENAKKDAFKEWVPHFGITYRYSCLFRFASILDYTLMAVGTLAAVVSGFCIPAIIYFFGNLIRTKVLADKMECASGTSGCDAFLKACDENTRDHSKYLDRAFLKRPLDNHLITTNHLQQFIDLHLIITFTYTVACSIYFFCWNYASQNQGGKLRRAYFQSLLQKDLTWFETQDDPEGVNRLMENTRFVQEVIGESIPTAISLIVMCTVCVVLACMHGWQLTMVCLSALPLIWGTIWLVTHLKAARVLKERRAYRIPHDLAKEVFSKIRTVIGYGTQQTERALYKRELSRGNRYVTLAIFMKSMAIGLMYIVTFGLWAIVFWYGMDLVMVSAAESCSDRSIRRIYDAGDMFVVIMSTLFGCTNFYVVIIVANALYVAKQCCREVLKVIDGKNGVDNMSDEGLYLEKLEGRVEFIDVRFTYPGKKSALALNNLSFVVEPNTTVAIVGMTDSGKSTTLKLICKEYLADSGFIEIDGHDVRNLNTNFLRSYIGYIPQELTLFDMSIEDNVRMGKLDANFFQVQEACIMAGAHDFIISFKEGYQTKIGHKGNRLTPGQKQLLAIARALIRKPKILLLDEPTFALDSQSVVEFMRSLQSVSRGRTVILVAHRLATVVHANMIYVLKNGRVVEKGDHHKLLKNKGPYNQLCMMNRPSNSFHPGSSKVEGFDTSEMTRIFSFKTFHQKLIIPNLYNDMSVVDPVISKMTQAMLKNDKDTERGFHAKLEWSLSDGDETLPKEVGFNTEEEALTNQIREKGSVENMDHTGNEEEVKVPSNHPSGKLVVEEEYHDISILNTGKKTWLRILRMGSTNYFLIFIGSLSTMFLSVGMPLFGFFFALTIDMLSDIGGYPRKWRFAKYFESHLNFPETIACSIAILGLYSGLFAFLQDFCLNLGGYKSIHKVRRLLYACILNQDMAFFDDPKYTPSILASILFQDTNAIRHVSWGVYATLLQSICIFGVSLGLCIVHEPRVAGYTFLFMILVIGFNFVDGWLAKKQAGKTMQALQSMSKLILQVFQSKHVITVCQMEPHFLKEFTTLQRKSLGSVKGMSCVRVFTYGIAQSAVYWGFGLFLYLGESTIDSHAHNFLDVMINGFVIIFGLITLGTNLSAITGFKYINKGGKRMLDIINRIPKTKQEDNLEITAEDCTKEIEFVNTQFWKPLTPDAPLLRGINLTIPPNQVTAIVGYPESGKSSFLELLGRYYDATGGLVTIAGKDIRYYSAESLREHLSVIIKEPELFSRTVAHNIALGATFRKPTMDDVIQAAKEAKCHNLIVSLPQGYETRIGGEHDYLSSAQKQKISIARALLKNPRIIVCDEITHVLDKEGERAVLESLNWAKQNRTVILISHRIQPVQDAHWVVVMEKGYLEEQGRHQDLLQRRSAGIYAQMWRSQNPLQDEAFVKGTISFTSRKYDGDGRKPKNVPSSTKKKEDVKPPGVSQSTSAVPGTSSAPQPPPPSAKPPQYEDDEIEEAGGCGFLSFLGLGIVEPKDKAGDDEVGDKFRKLPK